MKKVLVLTDFTPTCFWSVTYGLDFCRYYGFQPEVLHVETPQGLGDADFVERKRVMDIVNLYNKKFNLDARLVIRKGLLDREVSDEVEEGGFCLVVLCTHGKQVVQSVTGSAVEKIIMALSIPIIVVQSKRFSPVQYALLPVEVPEFNPLLLDRFSELARVMDMRVEFVCREDNKDFCDSNHQFFPGSTTTVLPRSQRGLSFMRQVESHGESHGADMILGIPSQSRNSQYVNMMDQLLFNIPQIPVMCR